MPRAVMASRTAGSQRAFVSASHCVAPVVGFCELGIADAGVADELRHAVDVVEERDEVVRVLHQRPAE